MPDIRKAVDEMFRIAADNKHGYSQENRRGNPDYDCSSLVIHCLDYAGFPMSTNGASYTGNMLNALKKCGFTDVTKEINLKTGQGMKAGDVFLTPGKHTAMAVSESLMAAAHSNYDGKAGDGSGKEIDTYKYKPYSKGWKYVFRYQMPEKDDLQPDTDDLTEIAKQVINGNFGNGETRKIKLRAAGYDYESVQKLVNEMLRKGVK